MDSFVKYLSLAAIFLTACQPGEEKEVKTDVKLSSSVIEQNSTVSNVSRRVAGIDGPACSSATIQCTPLDLEGRIFSGNAMLGELGPGARALTMLGASDEVLENPSHGIGGTLYFSLMEKTVLAGKYYAPAEEDMPSNPIITRMEFNYDYLDATVKLSGTADTNLDGIYIVRTVFVTRATAEDVNGEMQQGDKLLRKIGETQFRWCNTSGCSTTRSDVATGLIQETKLVEYIYPGQGNENYIPFTVPVDNELKLSYEKLTAEGNTWSVDFDMTNAIKWHQAPSTFNSEGSILSNFELDYIPDQQHGDGSQPEISVTLTIDSK